MPSLATGALTVNHELIGWASAATATPAASASASSSTCCAATSDMVYIIENNGVYGLTKGQFSATADIGQELKYAGKNELPPIDLCLEAIASGAGFVARIVCRRPQAGAARCSRRR